MRKVLKLLLVPLALTCVGLMRLLWPWVKVRIGDIWSPRIGHMLGNMECYLCERDAGKHDAIDLWFHRKPVSNKQAARMLESVLHVDRTGFLPIVDLCNRLFRGWEKHVCEPDQCDRDIHNLMEKYPPHLKFTRSEERRGARGLRKLGITEDAKWVCLIVRDNAYLPQLQYHKHRDSDVFNYVPMALALAQRGYYVIRMGAKVAGPFAVKHSKIIDYATDGQRTDFMDMYLGAKCEFCVSNSTGFDAIPMVFRRPIVYVNQVPIEYLMTFNPRSLAIWKHHIKDGKRMHPREIFEANAGQFMRADEYETAGITLEENTPQEIMSAVLEMADPPPWNFEDEQRQKQFWDEFPRSISPYNSTALHGAIRMRIGREFIRGYDNENNHSQR